MVLSLVGKFGIAAAFAIIYIYSAEIFPTDYRSVAIGACSMIARVGGMLAPSVSALVSAGKGDRKGGQAVQEQDYTGPGLSHARTRTTHQARAPRARGTCMK